MKARLMNDFKESMKAKDSTRKAVVAEIRGAIKNKEINEKIEVSDAQIIVLVQKIQKEMHESLDAFEKAENAEQVAELKARLVLVATYLPKEMDEADLKAVVEKFVEALEEKSMKSMGRTIAAVKSEVEAAGYLVNGGKLSGLVKAALA
ncbi:GatB/YqeY domain-containing protein [Lentisphaera profundi]|uniref:GatB/YqeY domain-containing protein n=1 Tax=Lentisphaera profundi TaxID=1658616 RepID=A0ABY7VMY2_9BACT|nr:GatB/YqeY domain-containing protein [Lentisphaera profundi]WDE95421.1 GatB/YqeY domain-containing protein [Lentisphaera profundi]